MFVNSDYGPPLLGLEAQEEDGSSWRPVTVYQHTAEKNLVLWYGGTEYEGLGGNYRWQGEHAGNGRGSAATPRVLLDSSGGVVATRPKASTPEREMQHLPFEGALTFVRSLRLASFTAWQHWASGPRHVNRKL